MVEGPRLIHPNELCDPASRIDWPCRDRPVRDQCTPRMGYIVSLTAGLPAYLVRTQRNEWTFGRAYGRIIHGQGAIMKMLRV